MINKIIGIMLMMFAGTLMIPIVTSLSFSDGNLQTFIVSLLVFFIIGTLLYFPNSKIKSSDIKSKEGFLIVVLFWLILSLFGSLPFILDKDLSLSFVDALFESISGWTTTGATIIDDLENLSPSILIYRQMLQWLGGMGIVILALAILPMLGVGGMQLYKAESTGPIKDNKISPRIAETAKSLWRVYIGLTIACALLYFFAGMSIFDSVAHSFSTIAIGGFSTYNDSIGHFNSPIIEFVCIIFMLLAALNFILHFLAMKSGSIAIYFKDTEVRSFTFIIIIFLSLIYVFHLVNNSDIPLRHIIFQLISFITTSGFTSTSYESWPSFIVFTLLLVSFFGACAGSTGGGIKIIRIVLVLKLLKKGLLRTLHPTAQVPVKINDQAISDEVASNIYDFIVFYILSYMILSFLLLIFGNDIATSFSSVASCLNNLGPAVGDAANSYSSLSTSSKYVLSFTMILGRLEIYTLLIILTPYFWKY
jgi:trk system potassium uptake protein TrkH|tara:strand:- start:2733 stop:4163 length:1431 start_codon:yes stop_codon:yes gene_type:complete